MGRKRIPTSPASPFYGYHAEVIAEWCGVSVGTAEHYKAGRRKPPTPVLRLLRLYRDGKVLADAEWDGFRVNGSSIIPPGGRPMTRTDFYLTELIWQALADADPQGYRRILRKAANIE